MPELEINKDHRADLKSNPTKLKLIRNRNESTLTFNLKFSENRKGQWKVFLFVTKRFR